MKPHLRTCTVMDIPEMLAIAVQCYPPFNQRKAVAWAESAMMRPEFGFFRTDNAWGCAVLADVFYEERPRCAMMFLAGRNGKAWEAVAVLRTMVEWGRRAGAASFTFGEDTGMRMDVLAKRIGAGRDRPNYRLDLARPKSSALSTIWHRAA